MDLPRYVLHYRMDRGFTPAGRGPRLPQLHADKEAQPGGSPDDGVLPVVPPCLRSHLLACLASLSSDKEAKGAAFSVPPDGYSCGRTARLVTVYEVKTLHA